MMNCQDWLAVPFSVHIFVGIKRTALVAIFVADCEGYPAR